MDLSGLGKKPTDRGSLTLWRRQREWDLSVLGKKPTDRGGLTSWRRQRDLSGRGKKPIDRGALTSWSGRGRDLSGLRKKLTDRGGLTNWRRQREGLVRTRKETDQPRYTHPLETAEGVTCQDTERNRPSDGHGHSQTGECGGKGKLVCGNNVREQEERSRRNQRMECGLATVPQ